MSRFSVGICLLATLGWTQRAAAGDMEWSHDFSPKVQWYSLADTGHVLVGTNKSISAIDPVSGELAWNRDDLNKVPEEGVTLIPGAPSALVLEAQGWGIGKAPKGTLHMVNLNTGEDMWTVESGPVMYTRPVFKRGALMVLTQEFTDKGKANWVMSWLDIKTGKATWQAEDYFDHHLPLLKTWPANPDKKWSTKLTMEGNQSIQFVDDGEAYVELWHAKQGVVKRNAANGEIIWSRPGKYYQKYVPTPREGRPSLLVHDGKVFTTDNHNQLWAYDLASGDPLWNEKKAPKLTGTILSMTPMGKKNLLLTGHNGKVAFVATLSGKDGSEVWKKPLKMKGMLSYLEALDDGRLVVSETAATKTSVYVLDQKTGDRALAKPFKVPGDVGYAEVTDGKFFATGSNGKKTYVGMWDLSNGGTTWSHGEKGYRAKGTVPNLVVKDHKVFFVDSNGNFTGLELSDGSELFSTELGLQGKGETPSTLSLRDSGKLTTWSSQNVVGLDPGSGQVLFHTHYPPPPPTGLQVVAGAAMIAAAAAAAGASAYNSAQAGYASGVAGPYSDAAQAYQNDAEAYADISNAFGDAATAVLARAKASKASNDFYFILTRVKEGDDKGVGLRRVDLDSGEEVGAVIIDERDPDYLIDEVSGYLYLLRNDKAVEGYSFGPLSDPDMSRSAQAGAGGADAAGSAGDARTIANPCNPCDAENPCAMKRDAD